MTKICSKCKIEKPLSEFYNCKKHKDGKAYYCKDCSSACCRKWVLENPQRVREMNKRCRDNKVIKDRKLCPKCGLTKLKKEFWRYSSSKDLMSSWCAECNRATRKEKRKTEEHKKWKRSYETRKLKEDPHYKLRKILRNRLLSAVKKECKYSSVIDLTGISIPDLKLYIEKLFQEGMTWENHGRRGWHIDHIIPLCNFDLTNLEQQKKAFHYTNLQPLWAGDNCSKSKKIPK